MEEGESIGPSQNRPSSRAGEISDTVNAVSSSHIKKSEKETLTGTSHTQNLPSWQSDEEPTSCCISTCGRNKITHPDIRFFSFPKGAKIRVAWKQACKITYSLKRSTGICDAHFRPHEIGRAGAIPSLNMPSSSSAVTLDKMNSPSPAHIKGGGTLGISKKETLANTTNIENLPPLKSTMKASESRAHPLNLPEPFGGLEIAPLTPSRRVKSAEIAKVSKLTYPLTSKSNSEEITLDRAADAKRRKDDSTPTNPNELHPRTTPDIRIHGLPTDKDLRRACLVTCGILDSNFKFNGSTGVCNVQFLPNNLEIKILCKGGAVTDGPPSTNAVENLPPNSKQSALVYRKTEENGNRSAKETLTSTTNTQNLPSLKPTIKESESSAHPLNLPEPVKIGVSNSEIKIKRKNCGRCGISTCGKSYRNTPNIRIFTFPQDENLRRPWLKACGIEESNYTWRSYVGVCNAHFLPEEMGTRQLHRGAIPSQNLPSTIPDEALDDKNSGIKTIADEALVEMNSGIKTIADEALDEKNSGIKTIADEALVEMNSGIKTIADEALDEMNSGSPAPIKGDCALGLPANETLTSTTNSQNLPSLKPTIKESESSAHPLNLPEPLNSMDNVKIGVSNSETNIKRKNCGRCCISTCGKSYRKTPNIRIFGFPKAENLRRAWLKACGIKESDFTFSSSIGVCKDHFLPQDTGSRLLRSGAIPSQNLPPCQRSQCDQEACNFCLYSHKRGDIYRARYRRTMRNLAKLKNKLDENKKKMRMVRSQFKFKLNPDLRRPKDCAKMRMILRKANGLSNSAQVMFLMLLKPFQSWNAEEKQLVLSLYYENPFALFDLRSKMNLHLPSRSSIIRWVHLDKNASKPKLLAEKTHKDSEWNIEDIDGDLENPDIEIEKIDADLEGHGDNSVINEKMNGKDIGFEGVECDDIVYEGAECDDTVFEGAGCDDTVYEGPECDDIKVEIIEIHDIDVYEERVFKCETE